MKIRKHKNGRYYAHLTGGVQISLRTTNKEEAERNAREAKLEEIETAKTLNLLTAEAVTRLTAGGRVTGLQALEAWKDWAETVGFSVNTIHRYLSDIQGFIAAASLGTSSVARVTEKEVSTFVNPPGKCALSTRRNRLSAIQSFFAVCVAKGFCVLDPSATVRVRMDDLTLAQKEPAKKVPFTPEELAILRNLPDPFWRTFILLGECYGFRISDVAQLEWDSIRADTILVWTDKRDKRLEMPMSADLRAHLLSLPRLDSTYVFPEQAALAKDPHKRSYLSTYFSRVLKRVGIQGKNTHCMRSTFATTRSGLGDSVHEIREKLGHTHEGTTERYINPQPALATV